MLTLNMFPLVVGVIFLVGARLVGGFVGEWAPECVEDPDGLREESPYIDENRRYIVSFVWKEWGITTRGWARDSQQGRYDDYLLENTT